MTRAILGESARGRGAAAAALVLAATSCDALIGLGEEPAPSSSSTGDATSSTGDAPSSTGTATVTGAGGAGGAGDGGGGAGGDPGAGGGGAGAGGAPDPMPCGDCTDQESSRCAADACVDGVCQLRIHEVDDAVWWDGNIGGDAIFNRLGRGLAILRDHIVFTAATQEGKSRLHVVNRRDGTVARRSATFGGISIAALGSNRVLLAEVGGEAPLARLLVTAPDGPLELPPDGVVPPTMNALVRAAGVVVGASRGLDGYEAGHGHRIDGFQACQVTSTTIGGGAGHLALVGAPPTLLISLYDVPYISRSLLDVGGDGCPVGTTTFISLSPWAARVYASTGIGEVVYATTSGTPPAPASVSQLAVQDDGSAEPVGPAIPAMPTRALAARGASVLIGSADGGVRRCNPGLTTCTTAVTVADGGYVHEIEATEWGMVTLGFVDDPDDQSDHARIVCAVQP